jgi:hypothetical protein
MPWLVRPLPALEAAFSAAAAWLATRSPSAAASLTATWAACAGDAMNLGAGRALNGARCCCCWDAAARLRSGAMGRPLLLHPARDPRDKFCQVQGDLELRVSNAQHERERECECECECPHTSHTRIRRQKRSDHLVRALVHCHDMLRTVPSHVRPPSPAGSLATTLPAVCGPVRSS